MQVRGCQLRQEMCSCVSFTPVPPLRGILISGLPGNCNMAFVVYNFCTLYILFYSLLFFTDSSGSHNNVAINRDMCNSTIFPSRVNLCRYGNPPRGILQTQWRNGRESVPGCFSQSLQTSLTWLRRLLLLFLSLFPLPLSPKYTSRKISEWKGHVLSSGSPSGARQPGSVPSRMANRRELRDTSCFQMCPHICYWPQLGAPYRRSWEADFKLSQY